MIFIKCNLCVGNTVIGYYFLKRRCLINISKLVHLLLYVFDKYKVSQKYNFQGKIKLSYGNKHFIKLIRNRPNFGHPFYSRNLMFT